MKYFLTMFVTVLLASYQPAFAEELCITIPDAKMGITARDFDYQNTVINSSGEMVPNTESRKRFLKRQLVNHVHEKHISKAAKASSKVAIEAARNQAKQENTDVVISSGE